MTDPLFRRHDSENSPIPDRLPRTKWKRGPVGSEVGFSTPGSNTGVMESNQPTQEIKPLPEPVFNLQGVKNHHYRFWRAPSTHEDKWEMNYKAVLPLETANPSSAGVDWLHIVFHWGCTQAHIDDFDGILRDSLGFGILQEEPSGRFNFKRQFMLEDGTSRFYIGGVHQRGTAMLAFPGSALQFLDYEKLRGLGENILKGWITRVDLCVDFYNGEYSVDDAIHDYKGGAYHLRGRKPDHRFIGCLDGEKNTAGRTLYIGKRDSTKMLRVYEKGKKQGVKKGSLTNWTRVEVELKGSNPETKNNRIIPWDVLSRPGSYLAGTYKALEFVNKTYDRIKAVAVKTVCSMKKSVDHLRRVGGKTINAMVDMGMNPYSIVSLLRGQGLPVYYIPERLKSFGIEVEEMRKWCVETFGCDQDFLLIPDELNIGSKF